MADRRVAIRLGTEGKAQVVADLDAIGTSGDAAFQRAARAAVKFAGDADAAVARANASAAKLQVLMPGLNPAKLDMYAGVTEATRKSAESSAAVFSASYAQMEARARALVAAIDPTIAAQDRFNREIAEARGLVSAGVLSLDQYVAKLRFEREALDQVNGARTRGASSMGAQRAGLQQLGFQLNDVAVQYASGTSASIIFAQQSGQIVQALQLMSGEAKGLLGFLGGPWGIAISTAAVALAPFVGKLLDGGDAAKKAKAATEDLAQSVSGIGRFFDQTTGAIKETNKALVTYAVLTRQKKNDELRDQQIANAKAGGAARSESLRDLAPAFAERGLAADAPRGKVNLDVDTALRSRDRDAALLAIARSKSTNAALARRLIEQRGEFANAAAQIAKNDAEISSLLNGKLDASLRSAGGSGGRVRSGGGRESSKAATKAVLEPFALTDFSDYADLFDPVKIAEAAERASREAAQRAKVILGGGADSFDEALKVGRDAMREDWEAQAEVNRRERQKREDGIRSAAGLYRDLMTGGVNSIWQRFQSYGLDVISNLLAKWTLGKGGGDGFLGAIGSLFGLAKKGGTPSTDVGKTGLLSGNARGTEYFSGGATWLAENGPEIVSLPAGSRVTPAAETRRLLGANDNSRGDTHIHVYAEGAVLSETVRGWVAEGIEVASVRGAAGGASMSAAQATVRRARKLGRY